MLFRYGRGSYKVQALKLLSISVQRKTNVLGQMQSLCSIGKKPQPCSRVRTGTVALGGHGKVAMHTGDTAWAAQYLPGSTGNTWAVAECSACTK